MSFPHVFDKDNNDNYSLAALFPKGADLTVLHDEIKAVAKKDFPDKKLSQLRIGLHDQGKKDFEGYEDGAFFLSATSKKKKPAVCDRKRNDIVDEDEIYPGLYGLVTIRVYSFKGSNAPGKAYGPGIGFGLQAVQSLEYGERLGNGGPADVNEEFEELEGLDDGDSADAVFGKGLTDDDIPF